MRRNTMYASPTLQFSGSTKYSKSPECVDNKNTFDLVECHMSDLLSCQNYKTYTHFLRQKCVFSFLRPGLRLLWITTPARSHGKSWQDLAHSELWEGIMNLAEDETEGITSELLFFPNGCTGALWQKQIHSGDFTAWLGCTACRVSKRSYRDT